MNALRRRKSEPKLAAVSILVALPLLDTQGFQQVQPGDLITADVVIGGNNDYWLEHLAIKDKSEALGARF